ncbi:hypothetical protein B0T16DRAFT_46851 [Cercophora newfieldiana]|uniref:Uncharacterized protein n=1 Tax=Cercophora newfieldiana TaxID=92897 RepID=A0AA40CZ63_9PEZI|nr:hypothetical protein B0T16DRAFT_46851 [Cercophora newfieldiana]
MCFHRRTLYQCNHFTWGKIYKACEVEKKFNAGEANEGCSQMWSHIFCTRAVEVDCEKCIKETKEIRNKISQAKDALRKLRETLAIKTDRCEDLASDSESDSDADESIDDETMSEIDVQDLKTPRRRGSGAGYDSDDVFAPTPNKGKGKPKVKRDVTPDPKHNLLYLPLLVQLPEGMRDMMNLEGLRERH